MDIDLKALEEKLGKSVAVTVQEKLDEIRNEVLTKSDFEEAKKDLEKSYGRDSETILAIPTLSNW